MKKKKNLFNNFWFGVVLTFSILSVVWCFEYADNFRSYDSTGTEVFMIALPLIVVWFRLRAEELKVERLKKKIIMLRQNHL